MNKVNWKRRQARIDADLVYGTHHKWIATLPCDRMGDERHGECGFTIHQQGVADHHLKGVAVGGEDRNNEIPTCAFLHDEFESKPLTEMCEKYRRDFKSVACDYTARFDNEYVPGEQEGRAEEGEA